MTVSQVIVRQSLHAIAREEKIRDVDGNPEIHMCVRSAAQAQSSHKNGGQVPCDESATLPTLSRQHWITVSSSKAPMSQ